MLVQHDNILVNLNNVQIIDLNHSEKSIKFYFVNKDIQINFDSYDDFNYFFSKVKKFRVNHSSDLTNIYDCRR